MYPPDSAQARRPRLALLIVVSLALGIGAMSTVGSIVEAVLLRALPFSSPERLVLVGEADAANPELWTSSSYPDYLDWKSQSHGFAAMAISRTWSPTLRLPAEADRLSGAQVSEGFFPLLGLRPELGRGLQPADFRPGAEPVAVLSHQIWAQRFGGDQGLLGRPLSLDGVMTTVVGILPESTALDEPVVAGEADLLKPLEVPEPFRSRGYRAMRVIARLADGATREQAAAEARQIAGRPAAGRPAGETLVRVEPLREVAVGGSRPVLLALLGAAALLLLIGCINAANVRLVELTVRRRELAVRAALGADRGKLFRQLLQESLPLVGMAFVLGLLLTLWAWDVIVALLPTPVVHLTGLALDGRTVAVTALVSLLALVLIDLLPFLELARLPLLTMLNERSSRTGESSSSRRSRNALVAAELALSLALLIGAGVLIRSLVRLSRVDLGFRPERVLALRLDTSQAYKDPARGRELLATLLGNLNGQSGVRSAAAVTSLPLQEGGNMSTGLGLRPNAPLSWQIDLNGVSPGYFSTLGIPLLRGRDFNQGEAAGDRHQVVILNATAARRLWPGEEAVGKRVILDWMSPVPREVVGVVGDLRTVGPQTPPQPEAYLPYPQMFFGAASLVVHTEGPPLAMAEQVRRQVRGLDDGILIGNVTTMEQLAASKVASPAANAQILASFAVTGLLLAMIGVYGVTSFAVSQKRHELGIRIAFGAQRREVVWTPLAQSARWIALGLVLGLAGGALLSRLFASSLYEISPLDPWTFATMPLFLLAVALWAGYMPARQVTRIDPVRALAEG
ncbi:MAG: ADOP family duplicated permease [Thermoanaerobaculia bacterium]